MNGIGRVVVYKDGTGSGETPEYAFAIWEGQIENGVPAGFARCITPEHAFVGYMNGRSRAHFGYGLYFKDKELKHNGFYVNGTKIVSAPT